VGPELCENVTSPVRDLQGRRSVIAAVLTVREEA